MTLVHSKYRVAHKKKLLPPSRWLLSSTVRRREAGSFFCVPPCTNTSVTTSKNQIPLQNRICASLWQSAVILCRRKQFFLQFHFCAGTGQSPGVCHLDWKHSLSWNVTEIFLTHQNTKNKTNFQKLPQQLILNYEKWQETQEEHLKNIKLLIMGKNNNQPQNWTLISFKFWLAEYIDSLNII